MSLVSPWMLYSVHQRPPIFWYCGIQHPDMKRHHATMGWMPPHTPTLGAYITRSRVIAYSSMAPAPCRWVLKRYLLLQMCRHLCKSTRFRKNLGNWMSKKEYNKILIAGPSKMESQKSPNKEFRTIVLKILSNSLLCIYIQRKWSQDF